MCLRQKQSYSNSRYFSKNNMQRLVLSHPCGQCAECIQQKRGEWYVRSYWQAVECIRNNGFFVSEALTYEDGHLPHVSDFFDIEPNEANFSCVDKKGVQMFLDRLHRNLSYKYFGANFELKHFICSEYGHDDVYYSDKGLMKIGTVRPHYHCLFFVMKPVVTVNYTVNKRTKRAVRFCSLLGICKKDIERGKTYSYTFTLTPEDFIAEVANAWQNGNTQNYKRYAKSGVLYDVPFFSSNYKKYVFTEVNKAESDLRGITNYITKYITKGDDYSARIGSRAACVAHLLSRTSEGLTEKQLFQDAFKMVKSKIGLFHLQSDGYGSYYLDTLDGDELKMVEDEGLMKMNDCKDVVRTVPLPMYYIRKLFYRFRKDDEGRVQWYLTDYGKECIKNLTYRKVVRLGEKYNDYYLNMPSDLKSKVLNLLDGRLFYDLASYVLMYKGRIVYSSYDKNDFMPSIEDIIDLNSDYNAFDSGFHDYENIAPRFLGERLSFCANSYLDRDIEVNGLFYDENPVNVSFDGCKVVSKPVFVRRWCINQDTLFDGVRPWHDFDELVDLFADFRAPHDDEKERLFKKKEYLENKFKSIGLKIKYKNL